jgi:hypothetical protein
MNNSMNQGSLNKDKDKDKDGRYPHPALQPGPAARLGSHDKLPEERKVAFFA